jgi:hypothetical protein
MWCEERPASVHAETGHRGVLGSLDAQVDGKAVAQPVHDRQAEAEAEAEAGTAFACRDSIMGGTPWEVTPACRADVKQISSGRHRARS